MSDSDRKEREARYTNQWILLASLLIMLLIVPPFEGTFFGRTVMNVGLTIVFVASVMANRDRKGLFVFAIVFGAVTVVLTWLAEGVGWKPLFVAKNLLAAAFLLVTAVLLLIPVLTKHAATMQAVVGAFSVYLLLGLSWACLYRMSEYVEAEPFAINHRRVVDVDDTYEITAFSQHVYFSFVTMSTLGYGDMAPKSAVTQTLAWMQAVIGQFYLAALVARLVAMLPRDSIAGK